MNRISEIIPLQPQGTNSTFFTTCCKVAITDRERNCPLCGNYVIGGDAKTENERNRIRWKNATSHWDR